MMRPSKHRHRFNLRVNINHLEGGKKLYNSKIKDTNKYVTPHYKYNKHILQIINTRKIRKIQAK